MGTEPLLTRQDDNGAAHEPDVQGFTRNAQPPGEESRLDEAMRRADDLLITSLRDEEAGRRGRRRKAVYVGSALLGGLVMIVIVIAILANFVATPSGGRNAGVNDADADALAKEGWALWQGGNAEEAQAKFAAAAELDPKNANTWNGLGWSRFNCGKVKAAEEAFLKAVKLEDTHPAALNGLGNAAFVQRRYAEAEAYWLRAAPSAAAAWHGLAKVYALQGKFDQSAKWAAKAAADDPDNETLKGILSAADAKKLDPDLRRRLEPPPAGEAASADADSPAGRGWKLMQQGKQREAVESFRAAVQKNPDDGAALNGLGFALLNSGKPAEAKPLFEKCLKLDPEAYGAMNGMARCLKAEDKPQEAIKLWEQMAEKAPGVNAATYGLAQTHLELRQYDKAIPYLEQMVKANPKDEDAGRKLEAARKAAAN